MVMGLVFVTIWRYPHRGYRKQARRHCEALRSSSLTIPSTTTFTLGDHHGYVHHENPAWDIIIAHVQHLSRHDDYAGP